MNGTTRLGTMPNVNAPANSVLMGAQDIDGNGFSDLLWQNTVNGRVLATPFDSLGAQANLTNMVGNLPLTTKLVASTGGG
jgi:hypothetical protein